MQNDMESSASESGKMEKHEQGSGLPSVWKALHRDKRIRTFEKVLQPCLCQSRPCCGKEKNMPWGQIVMLAVMIIVFMIWIYSLLVCGDECHRRDCGECPYLDSCTGQIHKMLKEKKNDKR